MSALVQELRNLRVGQQIKRDEFKAMATVDRSGGGRARRLFAITKKGAQRAQQFDTAAAAARYAEGKE